MTTERSLSSAPAGVRRYRGHTLEEILPQIRAELGPDAVILREREGLVGGVGGFFAQRFIEVDARRGDGQSIDVYDDAPDDDLRALLDAPDTEPLVDYGATALASDGDAITIGEHNGSDVAPERLTDTQPDRRAPAAPPEPRRFAPPVLHSNGGPDEAAGRVAPPNDQAPPRAATDPPRRFETDIFLERLREASAALPEEIIKSAAELPALLPPLAPAPGVDTPASNGSAPASNGSPPASERRPPPDARPPARRNGARPATKARKPNRARSARQQGQEPNAPVARGDLPEAAGDLPVAANGRPTAQPTPPAPAPAPDARNNPYDVVRQRSRQASDAPIPRRPARRRPVDPPAAAPTPPRASHKPAPPTSAQVSNPLLPALRTPALGDRFPESDHRIRELVARLLGRRNQATLRPPPPQPRDTVAAQRVAEGLSTHGASRTWTDELISAAGAHGSPLAGSLRAAAEAEIARRMVAAPALPASGAAIALVGAGGSGKTRCSAAMASAYRYRSTLTATVITLDNPEGGRALRKLLSDDGVPVLSLTGQRVRRAVEERRQGGLVILDTAATTPTDPDAVAALAAKLEPLALDAVYVALPATLGPNAARRALSSFGALHPTAAVITHADETDQLAVVVELAIAHRIPLAYFHAGTDHHDALSAIDPAAIAQGLFA